MTPMYYRGAHAALLVLDITSLKSFDLLKSFVDELQHKMVEMPVLAIAANKADMQNQRQVPQADIEKFAQAHGAFVFETSAKTNQGVDELFTEISRQLIARQSGSNAIGAGTGGPSHQIGAVNLEPGTDARESACAC
eukprot:c5310_g1_i1.p1 GENE.c5310_g1_i1~~c5310_g1_i1.p1  ORF type:complete len:137 (-),score=31.51 c5310_g1_i1:69-479(-)